MAGRTVPIASREPPSRARSLGKRPLGEGPPHERPPWDEPPRGHVPAGARTRRIGRARALRWAVIAALIAGPLVAGELGVRALIAADRLPVAAAHLEDFEITWTNLERQAPADVLLLGDSMTQQGLDPATLASLVEPALGRRPVVFNASSSAGGFGVNEAVIEELARRGQLPRLAIVGVSPSSMASDRTFRDVFAPTPMGGLFTRCASASSYDAAVNCAFGNVSAFWRWRGTFDRVLRAVVRPLPPTKSERGFTLRADGFRAGPPVTIADLREQVPTALEKEPAAFTMGADVPPAFAGLVDRLREHRVAVVAVAIPYSPVLVAALETRQAGWEAGRRAAVAALEAAGELPIVDPAGFGAWWGEGSSRDVKHLSRHGAPGFVEQLWGIAAFRDGVLAALR